MELNWRGRKYRRHITTALFQDDPKSWNRTPHEVLLLGAVRTVSCTARDPTDEI